MQIFSRCYAVSWICLNVTAPGETAQEIYQGLLDDIGRAIIERDKDRYIGYFLLPHRLQTFKASLNITSPHEFGQHFDKLIQHISELGVFELTRHCTLAQFVDAHTIRGYHETKLINQAMVIVEDYIALSTLTYSDGRWRVSASQYAEPDPSLPTRITQ